MSNNPTTAGGEPQAGETPPDPQPQAGNTTPQTEPQAGSSQSSQQKSADDYERMIADLRKENASHRTKLKKFEEEEQQRTSAQMSEQERLQKQLADLQKQHEEYTAATFERMVSLEVRAQAAGLGVINPDIAARLIEWEEIEVDESGNPTNVERLLKDLIKANPYLVGRPASPSSGGATNPPRSQTNAQPLSWQLISQMTAAEYNARRGEIQQFMADHPVQYGQRLR